MNIDLAKTVAEKCRAYGIEDAEAFAYVKIGPYSQTDYAGRQNVYQQGLGALEVLNMDWPDRFEMCIRTECGAEFMCIREKEECRS